MNTKLFIWISIVLLMILVVSILCYKIIKKNYHKELELTYVINAGIPFKWEFEIEDESVICFVKSHVIRNDNKGAMVGAKIYTNYVFKGLKEGETTITFRKVNITSGISSNEEKHIVKVDENLNMFVVTN